MRLVPEEVDLFESLVFDELQTITLVPSVRENVKRDLTANGECQIEVKVFRTTLLAKLLDECSADIVFLVMQVSLVVVVPMDQLTLSCSSNASRSCLLFKCIT